MHSWEQLKIVRLIRMLTVDAQQAWMDTEAYDVAKKTLLNQIKDMNQSRWPEHLLPPQSQLSTDTAYRSIDSWASFRKSVSALDKSSISFNSKL